MGADFVECDCDMMVGMVFHFGVGHLDVGHKPGRGALGLRGVKNQTHIYHGRWTFMVVWRGEGGGRGRGRDNLGLLLELVYDLGLS